LTSVVTQTGAGPTPTGALNAPVGVDDPAPPTNEIVGDSYTALRSPPGAHDRHAYSSDLPPGLTCAADGTHTGTPTKVSTYQFTVQGHQPGRDPPSHHLPGATERRVRNRPRAPDRESHGAIDIPQAQRCDFAKLRRPATIALLNSDRPDDHKPAMPMATTRPRVFA
jgi:hypothetical protein